MGSPCYGFPGLVACSQLGSPCCGLQDYWHVLSFYNGLPKEVQWIPESETWVLRKPVRCNPRLAGFLSSGLLSGPFYLLGILWVLGSMTGFFVLFCFRYCCTAVVPGFTLSQLLIWLGRSRLLAHVMLHPQMPRDCRLGPRCFVELYQCSASLELPGSL